MIDSKSPSADELGQQLSELTSTSESFQMVALGGVMAVGLVAGVVSQAGVPLIIVMIGACAIAGVICIFAKRMKRFSSKMTVFENGMEITVNGKGNRFLFSQVDQFSTRHTHHYSRIAGNDVYVGSRAVTEILLEGRFNVVRCDCEYHKEKVTCETVRLAGDKLCEAVELKLAKQLESTGEVQLTPNVFLTLDGLRIVDVQLGSERIVAIEEIEDWQQGSEKIGLIKTGSGIPFLNLSVDGPNFVPAFSLFTKLHQTLSMQAAAV